MPPFADTPRVPVTERVSPHALDMESRGAAGVLEALAACDAEMWAEAHADDDGVGASAHPGLSHPTVVADIARLALAVSRCVASDTPETPAAVLVVGCGTSGRLAFQCARAAERSRKAERGTNDRRKKRAIFRHVIAGGDAALFQSAESCEDDRERGASDFRKAVAVYEPYQIKQMVVVGVSCGLSAPYVSSFLAEAGRWRRESSRREGEKTRVARFALGFNPRRDAPPRGGFRELFPNTDDFEAEEFGTKSARACVSGTTRERDKRSRVVDEENEVLFINPVLGPELVAGSSRLKGGSATKIILDAAFAVAATINEGRGTGHERGGSSSYDATATTLRDEAELYATRALSAFAAATRKTHASMSRDGACASACARAAAAVAAGGDVRLVSVAEFADVADVTPRVSKKETLSVSPLNETLGVTVSALVDASEQRPTFGTPLEKYRAFGGGGWRTLMYGSDDDDGEEQRTRRKKTVPPPGCFEVSWDAYVRDAEANAADGKRKRKKARVSEPAEGKRTAPTFLLVLFAPGAGARAARQRIAARRAIALERAKHADRGGDDADEHLSFAFLCVRADASEPKTPPWEKDADGDVEASAFSADAVFVDLADETPDKIHVSFLARLAPRVAELGAKLCLNAISVAAHALSGKTFAGRMIDVRVSNAKLYHRAARVVAAAAGTDVLSAREALWRACGFDRGTNDASSSLDVSEDEQEDDKVERSVVNAVVARASSLSSVVPIAVLLARGAFHEARDARDALAEAGNDVRATLSRVQRPNNTREQ
jgi:N-acetylmuramic acid 6-phosphate (MurNAc-6-P) etherase